MTIAPYSIAYKANVTVFYGKLLEILGYSAAPYLPDYQRLTKRLSFQWAPPVFLQNLQIFRLFMFILLYLFMFFITIFLYFFKIFTKKLRCVVDNIYVTNNN